MSAKRQAYEHLRIYTVSVSIAFNTTSAIYNREADPCQGQERIALGISVPTRTVCAVSSTRNRNRHEPCSFSSEHSERAATKDNSRRSRPSPRVRHLEANLRWGVGRPGLTEITLLTAWPECLIVRAELCEHSVVSYSSFFS